MSKKNATVELARLRALVRPILLTHGTALAASSQTSEEMDDVIGHLAARQNPTLDKTNAATLRQITDPDVNRIVSDYFGAIMSAYGDAGYFVGLATGLELAAIVLGVTLPDAQPTGGTR